MTNDVLVYDMVSHSLHYSWAVIPTFSKWRTHVCGNEAQNVTKCHLEIMYLVDNLRLVDRAKVRMAPSMCSNLSQKLSAVRERQNLTEWQYLMPLTMHATDHVRPASLLNVDLAFAQIIASDEKGGLGTIRCEYVKQVRCIVVRTVIESQSHRARVFAELDSLGVVCDVADSRTRNVERRLSQGPYRCVATIRPIELAVRA